MPLGVSNGVVDLATGELRAAARDDLVTKRSPYAYMPSAPAPRFRRFITEITGKPSADGCPSQFAERPALARYLHLVMGYSITGLTDLQLMFIAIGQGSNGKNILLDTVQKVVGDYWRTLPPEALMATRHDVDAERPSPTAAMLSGRGRRSAANRRTASSSTLLL